MVPVRRSVAAQTLGETDMLGNEYAKLAVLLSAFYICQAVDLVAETLSATNTRGVEEKIDMLVISAMLRGMLATPSGQGRFSEGPAAKQWRSLLPEHLALQLAARGILRGKAIGTLAGEQPRLLPSLAPVSEACDRRTCRTDTWLTTTMPSRADARK
jgi:hypothetical protein